MRTILFLLIPLFAAACTCTGSSAASPDASPILVNVNRDGLALDASRLAAPFRRARYGAYFARSASRSAQRFRLGSPSPRLPTTRS